MRSLLLHTHDDDNFEARLQMALDLARKFDGHLTLMQSIAYDVVVPTDPFGISPVDISTVAEKQAEEFRAKTEARLQSEDVRWNWVVEAGYDGDAMTRYAAVNDLAIVAGAVSAGARGRPSPLAGMLAIQCRGPIMVVPDDVRGNTEDAAAVVCWNGSLEAARAMRAAVPLLTTAKKVHILCVGDQADTDDGQLPPASGASYLERHQIKCEVVQLPAGQDPVHETLRKASQARDAGLMVMGAYGQPRFIETLFGGVTRSILSEPPMPVLLAH